MRLLPGDVNLGDLIKAPSAESRHCKVSIFLLVMDKYLGEDTLRVVPVNILLLLKFSSTDFSVWSNVCCDVFLMVIMYFHHSFHVYYLGFFYKEGLSFHSFSSICIFIQIFIYMSTDSDNFLFCGLYIIIIYFLAQIIPASAVGASSG